MQELLTLSSMEGPLPLSDWPNSLNSNWFSDVVRFAAIHSPLTLSLLVRLCVKEMSRNVQERHVMVVMLSPGKELVKLIPELVHWDKVLPAHHTHPTSGKVPLEPALLTLQPPMHYQVSH